MSRFSVRPVYPNEISQVANLAASIFATGDETAYKLFTRYIAEIFPTKPTFQLNNYWVGLVGNEIVCFLIADQHTLHYGQAELRVGGIGFVCTAANHRGQGYAAMLMHETITYFAEQGAHLILLNGIARYYHKFGFSPIFPHYFMEISSQDASRLKASYPIRTAQADDIPQLMNLYNKHWDGRVAFRRNEALWTWRLETAAAPIYVVEDKQKQICGYIRSAKQDDGYTEVVVDNRQATMTFLSTVGKWHQEAGIDKIHWHVPPDDVIVAYTQELVSVILGAWYRPNGGWMARVVDSHKLLDTLMPELLTQSYLAQIDFKVQDLIFDVQSSVIRIGLRHQANSFCELGYQDFIRVVFGSIRTSLLVAQGKISTDAQHLLDVVFPPRVTFLGGWDWF